MRRHILSASPIFLWFRLQTKEEKRKKKPKTKKTLFSFFLSFSPDFDRMISPVVEQWAQLLALAAAFFSCGGYLGFLPNFLGLILMIGVHGISQHHSWQLILGYGHAIAFVWPFLWPLASLFPLAAILLRLALPVPNIRHETKVQRNAEENEKVVVDSLFPGRLSSDVARTFSRIRAATIQCTMTDQTVESARFRCRLCTRAIHPGQESVTSCLTILAKLDARS